MTRILIKNGAVLTSDGWKEPGFVLVDDDVLDLVQEGYPPNDLQIDQVIDAEHCAVMPGFINGHTHLSQTFMRGLAGGRALLPWLKNLIWPLQGAISPEELQLAAYLGLVENLKCGATDVIDHHKVAKSTVYTDHVCQAADEIGLRFTLARSWSDKGKNAEDPKAILEDLERLFLKWQGNSRVGIANGPLALWRCSRETLTVSHQMAQAYNSFTHFHVAETQEEVQMSLDEYGLRPVEWLKSIDVMDRDTQVVHAVWVTDDEIKWMKEANALVVHCPVSNAVLGSGIAPIAKMLSEGVLIRIGTDGPASNDNQDTLESLKTAVNLARISTKDATILPPSQALQLGVGNRVLAAGKAADLIVVDLNHPRAVPVQDIDSAIVLSSHGADVDTVIVEGKVLMQNKKVLVLDEQALLSECRTAIKGLRSRAGLSS